MSEAGAGIIYALRNEAMPGLVKIGRTSRDVIARMREVYGTGVPLPFECIVAREVEKAEEVEKALHEAFGPYRINPRREFFQIEERQVQALIGIWPGRDATPLLAEATAGSVEEHEAADEYAARKRPRLNFREMRIAAGAVLKCAENDEEAEVVNDREVRFRGEEMSLTKASQEALGLTHVSRPTRFWTHEGQSLQAIYDETYGSRDG